MKKTALNLNHLSELAQGAVIRISMGHVDGYGHNINPIPQGMFDLEVVHETGSIDVYRLLADTDASEIYRILAKR